MQGLQKVIVLGDDVSPKNGSHNAEIWVSYASNWSDTSQEVLSNGMKWALAPFLAHQVRAMCVSTHTRHICERQRGLGFPKQASCYIVKA